MSQSTRRTQITATSPAGTAGTVDVTVTGPGGTSTTSSADQFTYDGGADGDERQSRGGPWQAARR